MIVRLLALVAVAAAVVTAAAAQTKPKSQTDLFQTPAPSKAAPVKPIKPCSGYGDGFIYVPATDTCVKGGGYLSIDAGARGR
jgi:porin-like protein